MASLLCKQTCSLAVLKSIRRKIGAGQFFETLNHYSSNTEPPDSSVTEKTSTFLKEEQSKKLGGFAQAFKKFENLEDESVKTDVGPPQTFTSLLRNSKFIDLGDPEGKIVHGTVYHVVEDDLYIDFGWKFHCVCSRPAKNGKDYVRGAKVRLRIKDLELSTRFLGSTTDLTLNEAECILLGLTYSPARDQTSV